MFYPHTADWCALPWSPWVPLQSGALRPVPAVPGLYRIRPHGVPELSYIGQTGRDLRDRLAMQLPSTEMPFDDPHTAAPALWAWSRSDGFKWECSAAPVEGSKQERMCLEASILWRYRLETGQSTRANHGRFHPHYAKSGMQARGVRGHLLADGATNPNGGPGTHPIRPTGEPVGPVWCGLPWSENVPIDHASPPIEGGLYRLMAPGDSALLYVGETSNLRSRIVAHRNNGRNGLVSWATTLWAPRPFQRHELENDLIGAHHLHAGIPPRMQFGGPGT